MPIECIDYDYYNETSCGENVTLPFDPKLIEINKTYNPTNEIYFELEEKNKYRIDIRYDSGHTNIEDNRFIDIQSNLFSFEFIHEVFIF
jgi:hypothetical protein